MISVEVRGGERRYNVLIESGLLANVGELVKKRLGGLLCAIISDSNIAPLFGEGVKRSLASADFRATLITILIGEKVSAVSSSAELNDVDLVASGCDKMFAEISGEPTRLQLQFAGNSLRREKRPLADPHRLVQISISIG